MGRPYDMIEIWAILAHGPTQDAATLDEQNSELLAEVVELAGSFSQPVEVCAILLGGPDMPQPETRPFARAGITQLFQLVHPLLAIYRTEATIQALAWLIHQREPLLVIAHATANSRDYMPRLAARLHLPCEPNCLSVHVQQGTPRTRTQNTVLTLRSIYEGRAYVQSETILHKRPLLATLMPGTRGASPAASNENVALLPAPVLTTCEPEISPDPAWQRVQHLTIEAPSPEQVELEAAERIVAGGRGMGREGFAEIARFAHLLGAAVGATRVATDKGWVEHARQIGATGKSVHPRLYIACGISGAAQHTSGMRDAGTIVAINPDRTAPIFALADLGLLGDAHQILSLATRELEQPEQT